MKQTDYCRLINDVFRSHVYGDIDIFTPQSFDDFVTRNDIDLSRALFAYDGSRPIGTICYGQRGHRAWFSLMGILPEYRKDGLGRNLFLQTIDAIVASGGTSIEFEVVQRNTAIQRMVHGYGFELIGELQSWARPARRAASNGLVPRKHRLADVAGVVAAVPACWQREASAVARAAQSVLLEVPGAYAFVRLRDDFAYVLDAGASSYDAAGELLEQFDRRIPYDVTLFNEPAGSALSGALHARKWRIVERQFRMINASVAQQRLD
ncbi:MAG TPA: GNAT family N-acetyltransferase [Candidatus Aquilonibacter sp.]|nr:GNAT family N-acetyltransferase [Candidatus Aquilonibacter sp.]